jgi:hypothetical protein
VICQTSVAILSVILFVGGVTPKLAAQYAPGQSSDGQAAPAQEPSAQRLSATTERLEFDVASIRQNKSDATPYANFTHGKDSCWIVTLVSGPGVEGCIPARIIRAETCGMLLNWQRKVSDCTQIPEWRPFEINLLPGFNCRFIALKSRNVVLKPRTKFG